MPGSLCRPWRDRTLREPSLCCGAGGHWCLGELGSVQGCLAAHCQLQVQVPWCGDAQLEQPRLQCLVGSILQASRTRTSQEVAPGCQASWSCSWSVLAPCIALPRSLLFPGPPDTGLTAECESPFAGTEKLGPQDRACEAPRVTQPGCRLGSWLHMGAGALISMLYFHAERFPLAVA